MNLLAMLRSETRTGPFSSSKEMSNTLLPSKDNGFRGWNKLPTSEKVVTDALAFPPPKPLPKTCIASPGDRLTVVPWVPTCIPLVLKVSSVGRDTTICAVPPGLLMVVFPPGSTGVLLAILFSQLGILYQIVCYQICEYQVTLSHFISFSN